MAGTISAVLMRIEMGRCQQVPGGERIVHSVHGALESSRWLESKVLVWIAGILHVPAFPIQMLRQAQSKQIYTMLFDRHATFTLSERLVFSTL